MQADLPTGSRGAWARSVGILDRSQSKWLPELLTKGRAVVQETRHGKESRRMAWGVFKNINIANENNCFCSSRF